MVIPCRWVKHLYYMGCRQMSTFLYLLIDSSDRLDYCVKHLVTSSVDIIESLLVWADHWSSFLTFEATVELFHILCDSAPIKGRIWLNCVIWLLANSFWSIYWCAWAKTIPSWRNFIIITRKYNIWNIFSGPKGHYVSWPKATDCFWGWSICQNNLSTREVLLLTLCSPKEMIFWHLLYLF